MNRQQSCSETQFVRPKKKQKDKENKFFTCLKSSLAQLVVCKHAPATVTGNLNENSSTLVADVAVVEVGVGAVAAVVATVVAAVVPPEATSIETKKSLQ